MPVPKRAHVVQEESFAPHGRQVPPCLQPHAHAVGPVLDQAVEQGVLARAGPRHVQRTVKRLGARTNVVLICPVRRQGDFEDPLVRYPMSRTPPLQ
eukprot:7815671-Pyramimonas_sp.AAC.1